MKQVFIQQGRACVQDVPAPVVEPGNVLVRVERSCISAGTELGGMQASGRPLWRRVLDQPERLRQVAGLARDHGIDATRKMVQRKLDQRTPTGYSAAGTVIAVGAGIDDLAPGQKIACAGNQHAFHAEIIRVPRNLCVAVPDGLDISAASTVTLGAIALQGVRRLAPTLGETFVVVGLGVLGQLTARILGANGCKVIGMDPQSSRVKAALAAGMDAALGADAADSGNAIARLTGGVGADGVVIAASTPSDEVLSNAFKMCRRKGRVVVVGDVGLGVERADIYAKELDLLISTSYGPGRYDTAYEADGLDYPIGYVRWTENRNMAAYLDLLATGRIDVGPLIGAEHPLDDADAAFAALDAEVPPLFVLLSYDNTQGADARHRIDLATSAGTATTDGRLRLAVAGAGNFVRNLHLPNAEKLGAQIRLRAVMSRTAHNAMETARQFGADYAAADYDELVNDPDVDAILIGSRHDSHAAMTLRALQAGKHVLVEKPLALDAGELGAIVDFFTDKSEARPEDGPGDGKPLLLTGFNRRFAPFARKLREIMAQRRGPAILNYRMNAGHLPAEHWVHGPEGGGRNIGEACHIYDLFTYLTDSEVAKVEALAIEADGGHLRRNDNFVATIRFDCGSVATLTYTALGAGAYPKERMEVFVDGKVIALDDYRSLTVHGQTGAPDEQRLRIPDKGHLEELRLFASAIRDGGPWPIPLWQQHQAMTIAFAVEDAIHA